MSVREVVSDVSMRCEVGDLVDVLTREQLERLLAWLHDEVSDDQRRRAEAWRDQMRRAVR